MADKPRSSSSRLYPEKLLKSDADRATNRPPSSARKDFQRLYPSSESSWNQDSGHPQPTTENLNSSQTEESHQLATPHREQTSPSPTKEQSLGTEVSDSDEEVYEEPDPYAAMQKQREVKFLLEQVKGAEERYNRLSKTLRERLKMVEKNLDNSINPSSKLSLPELSITKDTIDEISNFNKIHSIQQKNILCQIVETESIQRDLEKKVADVKDGTGKEIQPQIDECNKRRKCLRLFSEMMRQCKDYQEVVAVLKKQITDTTKVEANLELWKKEVVEIFRGIRPILEKFTDPNFQEGLRGKSKEDYIAILKTLSEHHTEIGELQSKANSGKTSLSESIQGMQKNLEDITKELDKLSPPTPKSPFAKAFRLPSKLSSFKHELIPILKKSICGEVSDLPEIVENVLSSLYSRKSLLDLPEEWQKKFAIAKGKEVKGRDKPPLDKALVNKILKERYDFTPRSIDSTLDNDVMELIGDDKNDYVCIEAKVKGKYRVCYRNYVNVEKGIIIAASNYRNWDNEEMSDSPSLPNSEILLHTCKRAVAEREGKHVEAVVLSKENFNLTKIIGANLANDEALATINLFVPKDSEGTFNKETEGYYAVLGMRVCEGKLFLLEHHFSDLDVSAFEIARKTTGEQVDMLGDIVVGSTGERVNIIYDIDKSDRPTSPGQRPSNPGRLNELRRSASLEKAARAEAARIEAQRVAAAMGEISKKGDRQLILNIKRQEIKQEVDTGKISKTVEKDKTILLLNGGPKYLDSYNRGEKMAKKTDSPYKGVQIPRQLDLIDSSREFLQACQEYSEVKNPLGDSTSHASQDGLGRFPISKTLLDEVKGAWRTSWLGNVDTELMSRAAGLASAAYEWIKDTNNIPPWPADSPDYVPPTFLTDATQRVRQATQDLKRKQIL